MKNFQFKITPQGLIIALIALVVGSVEFAFGGSGEKTVEASLLATLMQELRSDYQNQFDKNELRESRWGALRFFQNDSRNNPIFDPQTIANIQRSFGNTVQVPVLDAQSVSVSGSYTRTCSIVDSENDSALVSLTFTSYGWGFSMTPASHYNNDVDYQTDFNRKMRKYLIAFANTLDNACISQLETDKNAYWGTDVTAYYAQSADALQVPQASKDDFYNNLESIFMTMDFMDDVHIIASTKHMPTVRKLAAQGAANDENDRYQFQGSGSRMDGMGLRPYNWWPTNRITNGGGVDSTVYAVSSGSCYIDNRQDADSEIGGTIGGDSKIWGKEQMPVVDMTMGSFYTQDCGDRSAIVSTASAGNTRSRYEGFEFSTDVVTATVYNSDSAARYNPIVKAEILQ